MKVIAIFGDYENIERIEFSSDSSKVHLIHEDETPTDTIDTASIIRILNG